MIRMPLSKAAQALQAEHRGADVEFVGVSTDTRSLQQDNLFVALHGRHFDAHEFVEQACTKGASAAMISQLMETSLPTLRVANARLGLGELAKAWRKRFNLPLVAVTGSNGKTTVKEMLASIFNQIGPVLVTQGNLNNDIGLPLTLLRLGDTQHFAVIELGANHPGEIAYLTNITRPTVALITNAGAAHLEGFGNVEGVARAKGEIFAGLKKAGTAIINADDPHAGLWRSLAGGRRCISFGLNAIADISAAFDGGEELLLQTPLGTLQVRLQLLGRHNALNALAAAAAAIAAGADLKHIKNGLEAMRPVIGRLATKTGSHGARVIDDTYNANPASLKAAIDVLATYPTEKWLVLGDMGELGAAACSMHEQAGREAREAGIDKLFTTGKLSRHAAQAFGPNAQHFDEQDELTRVLSFELADAQRQARQIVLLVKGSRAARMERVAAALAAPETRPQGG